MCFELNAAVVVVAVLVLRHTSSNFTGQCLAALSLLRALIRNRRDQASLLHCCDNTSPIATQLTHACDPILLALSECWPLNKLAKASNGANKRIAEALGNPG